MNKRLLYPLFISICISLLGIIAVQFFWIRNAFAVKESQFSRSVNDALGSVVGKIEARENMSFISRNFEGDSIMRIVQAFTKDTGAIIKDRLDSLLAINEMPGNQNVPPVKRRVPANVSGIHSPPGVIHYSYQYNVLPLSSNQDSITIKMEEVVQELQSMDPQAINFDWDDQLNMLDSIMNQAPGQELSAEDQMRSLHFIENQIIIQSPNSMGGQNFRYSIPQYVVPDPLPAKSRSNKKTKPEREASIQKLDNKARKIQDVIKQMAIALETKSAPIQQRINKKSLQSALSKSFNDKGIDLPFEFAVLSPSSDSNHIPIRSSHFKPEYENSEHRVTLFPNDLFHKPDMLVVVFPNQKSHVLKSIALLLFGSVIFTLIIILTSGGSIIVMIRQKKISDIKTDFINNMTHEFKTPIATISIAADSISNPRVLAEPETIKNFTKIIKEENNRMNTRVEQVLQMALLDSRDFKLRPSLVNVNQLIEKTVGHYRLQIEKREGVITTCLAATNSVVFADEDHLRNVLLNLLDNANKYSIIKPNIEVFSLNRRGKLVFGVKDEGIGMSLEVQRKVFDKFFRVTSGNIHNIKGFGLGLSYVKAIIMAHHGDIKITSEPGEGSSFEISMDVIDNQAIFKDNKQKIME